uniref:Uncharacterized protein n=1 Tax=Anguilla anguilla TaxID=7936 RepID=A0A0E9XWX7_ANGAN
MRMATTAITLTTIIPVLELEGLVFAPIAGGPGAVQWAPTVRGSDVSLLTEFLASQV